MIFLFVRRILICGFLMSGFLSGMYNADNQHKVLALWRMNNIRRIERPLSNAHFKESEKCLMSMNTTKYMHSSSFFSKDLHCFYIKRVWDYSCINEQGCLLYFNHTQFNFDKLDLLTKETIPVDFLPHDIETDDLTNGISDGVWYHRDYKQDNLKKMLIDLAKKKVFNNTTSFDPRNIILSDDFLHMVCLVTDTTGDKLILFSPHKPLFFNGRIQKLANFFVKFI